MADVKKLISNLDSVYEQMTDMFSGSKPRQFFIELYDSGKTIDDLLKEYTPDTYNSEWDTARQKNPMDVDKVMKSRRAIAFMASGKNGIHRRYKENELTAHVFGISRMIRGRNFLEQAKSFITMDSAS